MSQQANRRTVDLFGATSIVVANMIGTGVFTSLGYQLFGIQTGFGIAMIWLVGGLLAFCGAVCYAELATRFPEDGGEYYFLGKIYHPAVGFVAGFVSSTVGFAAPIAGAALALGAYLKGVFWGLDSAVTAEGASVSSAMGWLDKLQSPDYLIAIGVILLITGIHWWNARVGIDFQKGSTVLKISMMVLFIVAGIYFGNQPISFLPSDASFKELFGVGAATVAEGETPWWQPSWITGSFAISLVWVSFAFSGWNASTYIAGTVVNPEKNLSRSIIAGTLTVTVLYVLLNMVFMMASPIQQLVGVKEVGLVAAQSLLGKSIGGLMGGIISLLLVSTISSMVFAGPRVLAKMFEAIPATVALSKRESDGNPRRSIVVQLLVTLVLLFAMDFPQLIYYIAFTLSLFTMFTVLGMVWLRIKEGKPSGYRALGYPVTPILFLAATFLVAMFFIDQKPTESLYGLSTIVLGLLFYGLSRISTKQPR